MKIGINGFGRIGRNVYRAAFRRSDVEIVAVNDLTSAETLAMLLQYDSVHGRFPEEVRADGGDLIAGDRRVKVFSERDPGNLPWAQIGVDIVVESTGLFTNKEKAEVHITRGGAKKVVISAPATNEDVTIVMGVNNEQYDPARHHVISNASCTTNCLAPIAKVVHESFGIVHAAMTTVHSYTNDQQILDLPHKDMRRMRAAALNIIPTTTGAARAVGLVLPALKGKINGFAVRVPTPNVSVVDMVAEVSRTVTVDEVNAALLAAAQAGSLKGFLSYTDRPLVSSDFNGNPHSSIVDSQLTMVIDGKQVKVVSWYDNEWGYSNRVVDLVAYIAQKGL